MEYGLLWQRFKLHFSSTKRQWRLRGRLSRKLWPERAQAVINTANLLLDNTFLFQDPWDMEQTREPVHFDEEIRWSHQPGDDPEFVFQMNRHRYWICLGQAYHLTGQEKYAECLVRQLMDWIEKEPYRVQAVSTTWRTLEAGIRAENWCRAMALVADSPAITPQAIKAFFEGLEAHGRYLYQNPNVVRTLKSNWGIFESTGLFILGCVLGNEDYIQRGRAFLKSGLHIQVVEDGMHWEVAPMYHNQVLKTLLSAYSVAKRYSVSLFSAEEMEILKKMAWVSVCLKTPNHCQPMVGDSDNTDVRDLLTQCAYIFRSSELKFGGYEKLDFESIWWLGRRAVMQYGLIPAKTPKETLFHLEQSGQVVLRGGWNPENLWLYYVNGMLGAGHGHCHKLHFGFWMDGDEVLVDPGRYTYVDKSIRYELKNARSHNVPMLRNEEYAPAVSSWRFASLPVSTPNRVFRKDGVTLIEGGHVGYLDRGIYVNRRIVVINEDIIAVCDRFIGNLEKTVSQRFHFGQGIVLNPESMQIVGRGAHCRFVLKSFADGTAVDAVLEQGPFSEHYNLLTSIPVADVSADKAQTLTSFFVRSTQGESKIQYTPVISRLTRKSLSPKEGEAFVVEIGLKRYGIIFMHQDMGNTMELLGIECAQGLGRTMVFDLNQEPAKAIALQW